MTTNLRTVGRRTGSDDEYVAQRMVPGTGISGGTGTVYASSVSREAGLVKTEIFIDLTGLRSTAAGDIIGIDGTALPCHIGQIKADVNGAIVAGMMTCLEAPAGGGSDIDLFAATEGTGSEDVAISTLDETSLVNAGVATIGAIDALTAFPTDGQYLYLVNQAATDGTYTAGKFLIELWGTPT